MKKEKKVSEIFSPCAFIDSCRVHKCLPNTAAVRRAHGTREKPNLSTRLLNEGSKHKANHIQLHVILIIYGQASSWIKRNEEDAQPKYLCSFERVPIFKLSIAKRKKKEQKKTVTKRRCTPLILVIYLIKMKYLFLGGIDFWQNLRPNSVHAALASQSNEFSLSSMSESMFYNVIIYFMCAVCNWVCSYYYVNYVAFVVHDRHFIFGAHAVIVPIVAADFSLFTETRCNAHNAKKSRCHCSVSNTEPIATSVPKCAMEKYFYWEFIFSPLFLASSFVVFCQQQLRLPGKCLPLRFKTFTTLPKKGRMKEIL